MTLQILLFAGAVDLAGARTVQVTVSESATLADVADELGRVVPQLSTLIKISRWAMDREFRTLDTPVDKTHEIALIPPVSGG